MDGIRGESFSAGAVLDQSFRVFRGNLFSFCLLALSARLPMIAYSVLAPESLDFDQELQFATWIGDLLIAPIVTAAITIGVVGQLRGNHDGVPALIMLGLANLLRVLKVSIVMGLFILLATLALVVPGMILWCVYFVAVPAAVVERLGIGEAFARSGQLTRGHRWKVLALGLAYLAGLVGVVTLTTVLWPESFETWGAYRVSLIIGEVLLVPVTVFGSVIPAVAYHDLCLAREGVDAGVASEIFD